jgi:hypothetical protein
MMAPAAASARQAKDAMPLMASTASMPSSDLLRSALQLILPTCAWRSPRWTPWFTCEAQAENVVCLSLISTDCRGYPQRRNSARAGELITAVELPAQTFLAHSTYRKVRDRASYAFALVSVAAALDMKDGLIGDVRIALGGVAHKAWRALKAEAVLRGKGATPENFRAAAEAELAEAKPLSHNAFKVELAKRTITAVLQELSERIA